MAERDQDRNATAESREAKLAKALRANLRRRKAAPAQAPAQDPHKKPTD